MDKYGLSPELTLFIILAALWTLYWKGLALWKAARSGQKHWFIGLLVINTLGILEIIYLYSGLSRPSSEDAQRPKVQ
jgi:hypothetical protein